MNAENATHAAHALSQLRTAVLDRLASGRISLPLLPQVASQVVMLAGDPKADAARLSALIHRDPSLAGRVLQIANSPAYLPKMAIVSLQQAVARLGSGVVTEIAFVASLQGGTFKVPGYERELKVMWRHAIASGAYAKEIARIKRANVESAFLCGLLHAVGKPALLQVVADAEAELERQVGLKGTFRSGVSAVLAECYIGLGTKIAEAWRLPAQVANAIAFHADYAAAPAFKQDAMITCLADVLATELVNPCDEAAQTTTRSTTTTTTTTTTNQPVTDSPGRLRSHPVLTDLNLYPSDFDQLLSKRSAVVAVVESMTA